MEGGGYVGGADIGGTNQTVAVARTDGQIVALVRRQTPPGGTATDVLGNVLAMADEALAQVGPDAGATRLRAFGVGFGGPVDQQHGVVLTSHHVPGWDGFPLRERLQERLGAPVALDNDANAAALGEALFGAGRGRSPVLYVNVGTGIGGGVVVDGAVLHGAHGMAGEIGHVTVEPGGARCGCGKRGCLEAYASGRSLGRRAREAAVAAPHQAQALIRAAAGDAAGIQGPHVFQAAAAGDGLAQRLLDETAAYLGIALANAANLLDPAVIVLGGGLSEAGDAFLDPVRRALAAHVMPGVPPPALVPAAHGYNGGVIGALALAFQHLSGSR